MDETEAAVLDASRHLNEMKREALQVIFPTPAELSSRIVLITNLRGKHPNLYKLYLAGVEWACLLAMEKGEEPNWELMDPVEFLIKHAPSIGGERAKQAVEIARGQPPENQRSSWAKQIREALGL